MTSPSEVVLCTIGTTVHGNSSMESQDLQTFRSLSTYLRRIYVIAISMDDKPFVARRGNVVVVGLAQRRNLALTRLAFVIGGILVGVRLDRKRRVSLFAVSDPLISGILGLTLRIVRGRPLLVHLQGQLLDMPADGIKALRRLAMTTLARFVCRRADMVRCVSRQLLDVAISSGIPPERVSYLPSRVDTSAFSPANAAAWRSRSRKILEVDGKEVILFVGAFSPFKGVDDLLEAFPIVSERRPRAALVLIGSGSLERELRSQAKGLGVAEDVKFVGRVSHDQMPQMLAAAEVLVLPSLNEGLPRVILEAMASGVPVVATSVGGVPELVEDGVTGLLVTPADHAGLADAICRVLDDPKRSQAWGRAGRKVVERKYEREANIREYARLIESVAHAGRNRL